jgi:5-methylcytosine-specific restriction protein A
VFREGAKRTITVNAYERDDKARARCLAHFGYRCAVCSFSFGEAYGPIAERVIHVHHLRPLYEIGEEYTVDPLEDLRPVCPNCHAVLHLRKPIPYSIEELQDLLGGRVVRAAAPN